MEKKAQYAFIIVLLVLIVLGVAVLLPFLTPIVFGMILAYLFYPLHKRLALRTGVTASALIVSIFFITLVSIPVYVAAHQVITDVNSVYQGARDTLNEGGIIDCNTDSLACNSYHSLKGRFSDDTIKGFISQVVSAGVTFIGRAVSQALFSIPLFILHLVVTLFTFYYFLKHGKEWVEKTWKELPLATRHKKEVFDRSKNALYGLLYGHIITALAQGLLGTIGFAIFGVPNPIFWGLIMAVASILPVIGAWLVWAPAALYLVVDGLASADGSGITRGILLFVYGLTIISLSDNAIRIYISSDKGKIHPLTMILGVFGGLVFFGITGFILGPLVLTLLLVFLRIYIRDIKL